MLHSWLPLLLTSCIVNVCMQLPGLPAQPACLQLSPPALRSAATEAFALWQGNEASAEGARSLLHLCGSIDVAPVRGSSAASDELGAMQDASRVRSNAGHPCGWRGGGASTLFKLSLPQLQVARWAAHPS